MSAPVETRPRTPMDAGAREAAMARAKGQAAEMIAFVADGIPASRAAIVRALWGAAPEVGNERDSFNQVAARVRKALIGSGYRLIHLGDAWYQVREGERHKTGPKPAVDAARLRGARTESAGGIRGYRVVDAAGAPLSGIRFDRHEAEEVLERMRAKARTCVRPCITCGAKFASEGPHNRMCPACRTGRDGGWMNGEGAR